MTLLVHPCYTLSMLKYYKMDTANPVHTPATPPDLQASDDSPLLSDTAKRDYQSAVGSLIFCINRTRVDIAFATMQVVRHTSSPREIHLDQIKRIFRYLRERPALLLQYKKAAVSSSPATRMQATLRPRNTGASLDQ